MMPMENNAKDDLLADGAVETPGIAPMENNAKAKKIWGAFVLIFLSGLLLGGVIGGFAKNLGGGGKGCAGSEHVIYQQHGKLPAINSILQGKSAGQVLETLLTIELGLLPRPAAARKQRPAGYSQTNGNNPANQH